MFLRSKKGMHSSCGLFFWRPQWLQRFVSYKAYLCVFAAISLLQGMVFSCLTVILSTVEKQFGLKSKEAAWIYSGNEISQICFIVFLPFVGRVKRKPLAMGLASTLSGIGIFLIAVPHLAGRGKQFIKASLNANVTGDSEHLCRPTNEPEDCDIESTVKDWLSMIIIFIGIFIVGIGSTGIYSFGLPFLDDSSGKENSPYSLTFAMVCRTLGPGLGFLLGTASLSIFVYPDRRPQGLGQDDPRWIGAWWMGFIILGVLVTVISPLLTLFPPLIPGKDGKTNSDHEEHNSKEKSDGSVKFWMKELAAVTKRLMTNKLFVCNLLSTTFVLMGVVGFATFMPKYFEFVFRRPASTSGIFGGLSQSLASMLGIAVSGFIVGRFRPRARPMAAWCAFVTFIAVLTFIGIAQINCGTPQPFFGYDSSGMQLSNLTCDLDCGCSHSEYSPVCSVDGGTAFFSPCQAGCKNSTLVYNENTKKQVRYYFDCSCVEANSLATGSFQARPWWTASTGDIGAPLAPQSNPLMDLPGVSPTGDKPISAAMAGDCPLDCEKPFYSLLALIVVVGVLVSTSRLPNTLLSLRSVEQIEKRDKSSSMTLTVSFVSLFAILPSPLVFGALYDSSCSLWGERCGSTLNCLAYDTETLQFRVCLLAGILKGLAFICDLGVWYYSKDVQVYDDTLAAQNKVEEATSSQTGQKTEVREENSNEA